MAGKDFSAKAKKLVQQGIPVIDFSVGEPDFPTLTTAKEAGIKAIEDNFVPPTTNLENPDPECDLDYTPLVGKSHEINHVLSNSFGFGGHNTTVVISRYQ